MSYRVDSSLIAHSTEKRKTFVFMASQIMNNVGSPIWRGILDKAKKLEVDLICFVGGGLGEDNTSLIYNLVDVNKIDGVISWTVSMNDLHTSFYDRFKGHPFVALSVPIPDLPVVMADSYQGMKDVVEHLVKEHSYTKVALVRGPDKYVYYPQRYQAYIDVVKENNIYDENLITPPLNCDNKSGIEGIRVLLDERNLKPGKDIEAIVFVSDIPAIAAFKECTRRNIQIPEQLAITGYNVMPEALCQTSPITNVRMPFEEQGITAIDLLSKLINNNEIPLKTLLPAKTLFAQSCGCQSTSVKNAAHSLEFSGKESSKFNEERNRTISKVSIAKDIMMELRRYAQNHEIAEAFIEECSGILPEVIFDELENNRKGEFLLHLKEIIKKLICEKKDISILQDVISIFRHKLSGFSKQAGQPYSEGNLWSQAQVLIAEAQLRAKEDETLKKIKDEEILRDISIKLITNYDINMLMNVLVENLPILGIPSCYISLYENPSSIKSLFDLPERSRLILAYENGKRRELSPEGIIYKSNDFLPEGYFSSSKQKCSVVHSLNFNDIQLGFIVFEMGPEDGSLYYILSNLLSSAIKGALLVNETMQKSNKLSEAYQNLQENQKRLLSSEKMASLGRLTAGIAHEMNTPLASVLATMHELKVLITEFRESIYHSNVLPEDHKEIAEEMEKNIAMSIKSTKKSASFIRGIKGQISGVNTNTTQFFPAYQIIFDTLNLLEFQFKHNNCSLITEIDESIVLSGNPRCLSQIVTNLINNAIEAADGAKITITVKLITLNNGYTQLIVEDTGPGIPQENLLRIFDPFFTSKPFGNSSGLGLVIVKDLVNHFNGTIDASSKNGITQFTISLPLAIPVEG